MTEWLMLNRVSHRQPYVRYSLSLPLKLAWQTKITGGIVAQAVASGDCVYIASFSRLHKLDLQTGKILWEFKTEQAKRNEEDCHLIGTPAIWKKRIYLSDESFFVYCLNRDNGELIWQTSELWSDNESICIYQDRLFLKTTIHSTGAAGYLCITPDGELIWAVRCTVPISMPSAVINDLLLFGDKSGLVYGVQVHDGQIRWCTDIKALADSTALPHKAYPQGYPMIVGSTAIIKVAARSLVGLDVQTGAIKWQYVTEEAFYRKACDDKNLYYVTLRQQCICIDINTGQLQWITDNKEHKLGDIGFPGALGLVVGGHYIAGFNESHKLVAFSTKDGRVEWEYTGGGGFTPPPIFVDKKLIVGCDDGYVYCFEEA